MTIKVKLNTSNAGIIVKPAFSTPSNPSTVVTLKNQSLTQSGGATRLDELEDVIESPTSNTGDVLVYNKDTDKYEVQQLDLSDISGTMDGGEF